MSQIAFPGLEAVPEKNQKNKSDFSFFCFNGASDLTTPGGHTSGRCSWPGSGL